MSKRLESRDIRGRLVTYPLHGISNHESACHFSSFITQLRVKLNGSPSTVYRVIVPSILSPSLYAPEACRPQEVLRFLHVLRSMLRQYSTRLTAMVTLPTSLHPRNTGICKWMELFFDGVIELVPIPKPMQHVGNSDREDKSQGLVRIHAMPVFHDKGGGVEGCWTGMDMAFRLSPSSGLQIFPFSLPPIGLHESTSSKVPSNTLKLEF